MALIGEMHYLTIGNNTYSIPASGGDGTVTSVGVSNATNGGLSISGSPITSSGTISIGHSNVLTSAQTTQAVYPIKIDKNGHISAYGTAVTIPTVPTNVSAFTNDAGYITSADVPEGASAYTGTISAVSTSASNGTSNGFARGDHVHNITGTVVKSALGTGSGTTKFLREDGSWATPAYTTNTDAKLQVAEVTSGSLYYPIVGTGTTAATRQYDTTGFSYSATTGTTSTPGMVTLTLGNSTASGTAGNKLGNITLYGSGSRYVSLRANVTATSGNNFTIYLPNKDGTVALTSDIPSSAANSTTGISISNHSTSNIGSASGWSAGTASTWAFEEVSIPNVTSAGSASTWTFEEKTIPNVTAAGSGSFTSGTFSGGSGSFSATVTNHVLSFSHTHTAATHGADSHTHTAPTIGTAIKVQSKSGGANGTAPTIGTAIKVQSKKSGSNSTVPSLTVTSTAVVTGTSHTITDNGHTHTLS